MNIHEEKGNLVYLPVLVGLVSLVLEPSCI